MILKRYIFMSACFLLVPNLTHSMKVQAQKRTSNNNWLTKNNLIWGSLAFVAASVLSEWVYRKFIEKKPDSEELTALETAKQKSNNVIQQKIKTRQKTFYTMSIDNRNTKISPYTKIKSQDDIPVKINDEN